MTALEDIINKNIELWSVMDSWVWGKEASWLVLNCRYCKSLKTCFWGSMWLQAYFFEIMPGGILLSKYFTYRGIIRIKRVYIHVCVCIHVSQMHTCYSEFHFESAETCWAALDKDIWKSFPSQSLAERKSFPFCSHLIYLYFIGPA